MKIFKNYYNFSQGVHFFVPEDEKAYNSGKPCKGFGAIRYGEGSVYCGDIWFDGKNYNKKGFGRQDFSNSTIGKTTGFGFRKAFYIGSYDYSKTDWIYGNGVLYYVDKDNSPAIFVKGFFEGLCRTGEWQGEFDYSCLAEGYTPEMERDFDEWGLIAYAFIEKYSKIPELENLFIGDSYFELMHNENLAGNPFYTEYGKKHNLNAGIGGTRFCDWNERFLEKLKDFTPPKRIILNLGFNDIHSNRSAEVVFEDCKKTINTLKSYFKDAEIYLLNVVKCPDAKIYYEEEEKFNKMTASAQKELGITCADMRSAIEELGKQDNCFADDNVHLNPLGYMKFTEVIENLLKN